MDIILLKLLRDSVIKLLILYSILLIRDLMKNLFRKMYHQMLKEYLFVAQLSLIEKYQIVWLKLDIQNKKLSYFDFLFWIVCKL